MINITNEFIEENKKLVYSIVNKYSNDYNREDLYQVGLNALLIASNSFDKTRNIKFTTYAYKYILGEILKYLREDKNIKCSRDIIKLNKRIIELKNQYYLSYGKTISDKELCKILSIDEYKIQEIENACKMNKEIDDNIVKKESISKDDLIILKDALENLDDDEKRFIYDRYYLNKTQTELAKDNNSNQVKIYRYEKKILDKLRKEFV